MAENISDSTKPKLMTTNRIETLVDGIFAISMTLLVLSLEVPVLPSPVTDIAIQQYLWGILPNFYVYALSFILLAVFWRINHEQFHRIDKADNTLVWINVLWLMFVALVPFSTSLVGDYGDMLTAAVFFNLNMLFIGLFSFFNWYYAYNHDLLRVKLTEKAYRRTFRLNLIFPIIALMAIGVSFISPSLSTITYVIISVFKQINDKI
jgi:uncharacterized membrane protein